MSLAAKVECPLCPQLVDVPLRIEAPLGLPGIEPTMKLKPDNGPALAHLREHHPEALAQLTPEQVGLAGGGQLPNEPPETDIGGQNPYGARGRRP